MKNTDIKDNKDLTPLKAIRKFCVDFCCIGESEEVRLCPCNDDKNSGLYCSLWKFRFGKGEGCGSRLKAIKERCLDCSGYEFKEIKNCKFTDCQLFNYRLGRNPKLKGRGNKAANFANNLKKYEPTA
ncbi:MAG TPA: hypothetical protein PKY81_15710 [bacterium]|nr:hypothetical protein [bacterium]